jgi:hypothetical protein
MRDPFTFNKVVSLSKKKKVVSQRWTFPLSFFEGDGQLLPSSFEGSFNNL